MACAARIAGFGVKPKNLFQAALFTAESLVGIILADHGLKNHIRKPETLMEENLILQSIWRINGFLSNSVLVIYNYYCPSHPLG